MTALVAPIVTRIDNIKIFFVILKFVRFVEAAVLGCAQSFCRRDACHHSEVRLSERGRSSPRRAPDQFSD